MYTYFVCVSKYVLYLYILFTFSCNINFQCSIYMLHQILLTLPYDSIIWLICDDFWIFSHLHEIVEELHFKCSLSVCLCVCLCVRLCLWTKFQPNGCTDLDAVFAKRLLSTLVRTLLKLMTLGQGQGHSGSKSIFSSLFFVNFPTVYLSSRMFDQSKIWYAALICLLQICYRFL